jgi:murein DD-endopeptidase MepM/ murein hydrolase activator NlpD
MIVKNLINLINAFAFSPAGVGEGTGMRHIALLAGLIISWTGVSAAASDMQEPHVSFAHVDWDEVQSSLSNYDGLRPDASHESSPNEIVKLNTATFDRFPGASKSSVPVLLPFDIATFLSDHAAGLDLGKPTDSYLAGFHETKFFLPGPSGYDAALTIRPSEVPGLSDLSFVDQAEVLISGSSVLYDLDTPVLEKGSPVQALEPDFPGIRRLLIESRVRYTFVRYGVPYMISVLCYDGGTRAHKLSCRQADQIVVHFLRSLSVVGGMPQPRPEPRTPQSVDRPAAISPDFTYYPPGQILPGTGFRGYGGRVDYTVYARIRFPLAQAPAYANSQSFMNWGDCDHTGRTPSGVHSKGAPYRCRVNDKPLVFDESKNYAYPWRDNFCEHRWFFVGQCPGGMGHQGQDIRPGECYFRNEGADRCEAYHHDVVAVRTGMVLRNPMQEAVILYVNAPGEHLRFRYLHMHPKMLDQDNVLSGRELREGEVIGKVGNYDRRDNGTTYHLHFDVQVPTQDGWVFINPYPMLVTAYERLIGGRGTEVTEEFVAAAPPEVTPGDVPMDGAAADVDGHQPVTPPIIDIKPEPEPRPVRRARVLARILHKTKPQHVVAHLHAHCFRRCGGE